MVRGNIIAGPRPGWDRHAPGGSQRIIAEQRWRILQTAHARPEPAPIFVRTPEQFVDWLSLRTRPQELRAYFRDLEEIARDVGDLELYRFARRYLGRAPKLRRG